MKKMYLAFIFLFAGLFSALPLFAQQTVQPLNPPQRVVVGYVPIMKFATLYVADTRGIFKKYGLDVQTERVSSGTDIIAFLTQGKIDVGGIAVVASTWNAWARGMDLRIIAPGALEPMHGSPTKLLVRKSLMDSGTVTSVADLRGKTVGMAGGPGSGGEYLAAKALERGGLTIHDVHIIRMSNPDMVQALENGSIDAGILGSPYADQAIQSGKAVTLAHDLTPGAMTVAFVGSGNFIRNRPDVARRFVLSLMEAARLMQGSNYLSPPNLRAYLAHVPTTAKALENGTPVIYDPNQNIPLAGLRDIERIHRLDGRLDYSKSIDLKKVVDTSFVNWALSKLGRQ